jgi:hypothetical protein
MSLRDSTYKEAFLHLQFPGLDLGQEIKEAVTLISIEQFTLVSLFFIKRSFKMCIFISRHYCIFVILNIAKRKH